MDEAMLKSGQFPNIAIEAGTDPKEVMREHGQVIQNGEKYELADSREMLEAELRDELRLLFGGDGGQRYASYTFVCNLLDRQAAITEREFWERYANGNQWEARQYELRCMELTAERDQLSRDLDAEHALVVQFECDNEELRDTCNTLRASVAGLKMTVERFKARESGDARQSG